MAQFCWKIRQLSTTSSKQNVHVVYLLCLLLKKQQTKKTILSLFKTHVFWACLEVSRNLRRKNCRKGKDFYKIHVQHVHCTLNWEILMTASFVLYTVCVYSAHRQVLPYSSRPKVSLLTATYGLPFFTRSSIPTRSLPGGIFPIFLPSIINTVCSCKEKPTCMFYLAKAHSLLTEGPHSHCDLDNIGHPGCMKYHFGNHSHIVNLSRYHLVPISLFWAPRTQLITGSAFGISFHFDWQTQLITFITCMVSSKLLYSLT